MFSDSLLLLFLFLVIHSFLYIFFLLSQTPSFFHIFCISVYVFLTLRPLFPWITSFPHFLSALVLLFPFVPHCDPCLSFAFIPILIILLLYLCSSTHLIFPPFFSSVFYLMLLNLNYILTYFTLSFLLSFSFPFLLLLSFPYVVLHNFLFFP